MRKLSRRFRECRQILRQRGVYRAGIAAAVRMAEKQYCYVSADDCIGADFDWSGIRFAYDDGYPSGKFDAAAVYRVPRAVFRCDEFYDVHSCRNVSADGGFGGVADCRGWKLDSQLEKRMILRCVGEQCSPLRLGNVQIVYNGAPSRTSGHLLLRRCRNSPCRPLR